jgi:hypothetical protein
MTVRDSGGETCALPWTAGKQRNKIVLKGCILAIFTEKTNILFWARRELEKLIRRMRIRPQSHGMLALRAKGPVSS